MLEILDSTHKNYIVFKVEGAGTPSTYEKLYQTLTNNFEKYGPLQVYEELLNFNFKAFLSSSIGVYHNVKYAKVFEVERLAIVSDGKWAKILVALWKKIESFWPLTAQEIR